MTSTFSLKTLIVDFYNGICASLAIHKAWPIFLKSYKVRYRTAQSFLFNGIIYLTSIMLVEYTIFPLIRHVIGTLSGEPADIDRRQRGSIISRSFCHFRTWERDLSWRSPGNGSRGNADLAGAE